jgi:tRNA (guanine-N7-)-methyltransferase
MTQPISGNLPPPIDAIDGRSGSQGPDAQGQALQATVGGARNRHIRSFSGRRGHFTTGQRQAYQVGLPRWGIPYQPAALDLAAVFGREAATVLEIGFGMGETTASIAAQQPQQNFLGVEVYPAGVGSLLRLIEERSLTNIRVIQHDAVEVLRDMIAPQSLGGVHVFFPDPWPKARHHKRRLIQPALVALLASRLTPGGYLHCATDWAPYAEHMLQVLSQEPLLVNTAQGWAQRPQTRPLTKFERRGLKLGHAVFDLMFVHT